METSKLNTSKGIKLAEVSEEKKPERAAARCSDENNIDPESENVSSPLEPESHCISYNRNLDNADNEDANDEELQSIIFEEAKGNEDDIHTNSQKNDSKSKLNGQKGKANCVTDTCVTDTCVTDTHAPSDITCSWLNSDEACRNTDQISPLDDTKEVTNDIEVIEICSQVSKDYKLSTQNLLASTDCVTVEDIVHLKEDSSIPESIFWTSILSAFDACKDYNHLEELTRQLKEIIPELKPRNYAACFLPQSDHLDHVAQSEIPLDEPTNLRAVATIGDRNCMFPALSKSYYNDDSYHIELRVRLVLEGVIIRDKYLSDDYLERGASVVHKNADFPTVFATFSMCSTRLDKKLQKMLLPVFML